MAYVDASIYILQLRSLFIFNYYYFLVNLIILFLNKNYYYCKKILTYNFDFLQEKVDFLDILNNLCIQKVLFF